MKGKGGSVPPNGSVFSLQIHGYAMEVHRKSLFQQLLKYVFLVKGSLTIPLKMIPSANVEIR